MQDNRRSLMLGCTLELGQNGWMGPGGVHSFGPYFPKHRPEHHSSSWSQSVLNVKRGDAWVIMSVGQLLAVHMEYWLVESTEYVMTYVPRRSTAVGADCPTRRLAHVIAEHLVWEPTVALTTLLVQVKSKAKRQRECATTAERMENVRGCYAVQDAALVSGKNVIVVDDIVTSGATMQSCASVLRRAGARSVTGVALARTVVDAGVRRSDTRLGKSIRV